MKTIRKKNCQSSELYQEGKLTLEIVLDAKGYLRCKSVWPSVCSIISYILTLTFCSFTNDDLQAILQCFQYTSTVLTSTLAFQNERKLKLQTQVNNP